MTTLEMALDYAARGLPVFPVYRVIPFRGRFVCFCIQAQRCTNPGKHPDDAAWSERCHHGSRHGPRAVGCAPNANLGIACSRTCVVLDVDPRHGGDVTLDQLQRRHGALPITWTAKTGGGGWHYFFPPSRKSATMPASSATASISAAPAATWWHRRACTFPATATPGRQDVRRLMCRLPPCRNGSSRQHAPRCTAKPWRPPWSPGAISAQRRRRRRRNESIARISGHLLRRNVNALVTLETLAAWNIARCRPPLAEQEVEAIVGRIADCELRRRNGDPHE